MIYVHYLQAINPVNQSISPLFHLTILIGLAESTLFHKGYLKHCIMVLINILPIFTFIILFCTGGLENLIFLSQFLKNLIKCESEF